MTESRNRGAPGPVRLTLLLSLFLVAGGVAAAVLWHDVLNEVLAGRPVRTSVAIVVAMVLLLGVSVALLARYLSGQVSDRSGQVSEEDGSRRQNDPVSRRDREPRG